MQIYEAEHVILKENRDCKDNKVRKVSKVSKVSKDDKDRGTARGQGEVTKGQGDEVQTTK